MQPAFHSLLFCNLLSIPRKSTRTFILLCIYRGGEAPPYIGGAKPPLYELCMIHILVLFFGMDSRLQNNRLWKAGCISATCPQQVAYQQPAHSRLPNLQDGLITNLRKFNNEMQSKDRMGLKNRWRLKNYLVSPGRPPRRIVKESIGTLILAAAISPLAIKESSRFARATSKKNCWGIDHWESILGGWESIARRNFILHWESILGEGGGPLLITIPV